MTIKAFNVSEALRSPVILLMDEILGHVTEKVRLPLVEDLEIINRKKPDKAPEDYLPYEYTDDLVPPLAPFGTGYRFHVTGLLHQESGFPTNDPETARKLLNRLSDKLELHRDIIDDWEEFQIEDADTVIYAYGALAKSARSAVKKARLAGLKWGMFRPNTIWPFLDKQVAAVASKAKRIIVAEMNQGQLVGEVQRVVAGRCEVIPFQKIGGEPVQRLMLQPGQSVLTRTLKG